MAGSTIVAMQLSRSSCLITRFSTSIKCIQAPVSALQTNPIILKTAVNYDLGIKFGGRLSHNTTSSRTLSSTALRAAAADSGSTASYKLVIYSKDECHLCEGLKEKLESLIDRAAFMPSILSGVELEIRDITINPDWMNKYSMTIPVLAAADIDGSNEAEIPRPSPRFTADALEKHLAKHLQPRLQA